MFGAYQIIVKILVLLNLCYACTVKQQKG